jgi:glutathione S-transferase|mmetsp:Transcript_34937/g.58486  ORF Transcript_34937/g.58486 Transcript_34937/m.58486 type:complete len:217 (-) Transcript_34937:999-1649(-)|eukprot:CAMPEP_0174286744 /NCGR_PEP_ID=MMETSP0809-20121228/12830_1 /TAXON_ID=73025 ORGANISM="Eutreptiella gymnastica-like, Strain CCMP1594" /NCGR_SAMPLE_ID=MMETSP0809 /ASSEMBLY_ACC=CAM_ASM_000658 /LENGTH=216 /DNA_ID=CAMNT_0015382925 /DNA_START=28 /DNA_END=678 /DNA_ORIENTATION=+
MSYQLLAPQVTGGAPEHIRFLFIVAGREKELDDSSLYPMDISKMKEGMQVACPAFAEAKAAGKHDANLGRMPVMLVDGVPIGQIPVIKRIVAKRMGLYSDNDIEAAQIDMVNEHLIDVKKDYNDNKKVGEEAVAEWFKTKLPEWMGKLEKCLGDNFAVGNKISWADVELFTFITVFFDNVEGAAASIKACPKIKRSVELIKTLPAMAEYLAKKAAK